MFGERIMKVKNICRVRHVLTNNNSGSTYDIIYLRSPRKIRIPYALADPLYCDGRRN